MRWTTASLGTPNLSAMVALGFDKSLIQEPRISWNSASLSRKMNQCLVIFVHTIQISVLLVWLLTSEKGVFSTN